MQRPKDDKVTVTYPEPCQTSKMERFVNVVNGFQPLVFLQNVSSYMFDRVLNTPLDIQI